MTEPSIQPGAAFTPVPTGVEGIPIGTRRGAMSSPPTNPHTPTPADPFPTPWEGPPRVRWRALWVDDLVIGLLALSLIAAAIVGDAPWFMFAALVPPLLSVVLLAAVIRR